MLEYILLYIFITGLGVAFLLKPIELSESFEEDFNKLFIA